MILPLLILVQAPTMGPCLDPNSETNAGIRELSAGAPCLKRPPGWIEPGSRRYTPGRSVPVPVALQAAIRRHFDAKMFDGPATRWKWPPKRDPGVYCGWLNGKNQFGAYTGWTPFLVFVKGSKVSNSVLINSESTIPDVWEGICERAGYDVKDPPE